MNIIRLQGNIEKRTGIYYEYDVDSTPLGEGGMGRVFKGYRVVERTGERMPVAIKAIYENIPERVVERARREANIQLDNDNLIRMYGFVETVTQLEGDTKCKVHYHVIMELLIGVTLEDIMNGVTSDQNGMQYTGPKDLMHHAWSRPLFLQCNELLYPQLPPAQSQSAPAQFSSKAKPVYCC